MELSKKALENVKFKKFGKWYNMKQVDAFVDELVVGLDGAEREMDTLRKEVKYLKRKLETTQENYESVNTSTLHQKKICEELEHERDELIENIKLLRRFREEFRDAMIEDSNVFLEKLDVLESDSLLY